MKHTMNTKEKARVFLESVTGFISCVTTGGSLCNEVNVRSSIDRQNERYDNLFRSNSRILHDPVMDNATKAADIEKNIDDYNASVQDSMNDINDVFHIAGLGRISAAVFLVSFWIAIAASLYFRDNVICILLLSLYALMSATCIIRTTRHQYIN